MQYAVCGGKQSSKLSLTFTVQKFRIQNKEQGARSSDLTISQSKIMVIIAFVYVTASQRVLLQHNAHTRQKETLIHNTLVHCALAP